MFRESLIETSGVMRARRRWATLASFFVETAALGVLVLVPLLYTEALPSLHFDEPLPPPPAPRRIAEITQAMPLAPVPSELQDGRMVAPVRVPTRVYMPPKPEVAPPQIGYSGPCNPCVEGSVGDPADPRGNVIASVLRALPDPRATIPPPKLTVLRISVMKPGMLISRIEPKYPPLAVTTRTQGTVVLTALIGRDGRIENLQAVSGHPMLIPAALDAVRQWRYRPTILNGQPVEVETQITVNFRLGQ